MWILLLVRCPLLECSVLLTHADKGCGLNVLNLPPMTSLSQLQRRGQEKLSMEKTAAAIMTKFEPMWTVFTQNSGSFAPFMDLYLKRWLHSLVLAIFLRHGRLTLCFAVTTSSL